MRRRKFKVRHPFVAAGRPDLAAEWHPKKNTKGVDQVTLGSEYKAWWVCREDDSHPAWHERVEKRALKGRGGCPACAKVQEPLKGVGKF